MKNLYIFPILLIVALLNCHEITAQQIRVINSSNADDEHLEPGIVPVNSIGLIAIVEHEKDHTWTDLDSFYQNVVLNKAQESYFENLKKITIWHLVNQFGMPEKAGVEKIAYYTNEQLSLNRVDVDVFIKCLEKLKGYWTNEQIRNAALQKYEDVKKHIIKAFGDIYWYETSATFERLKIFAASIPDR